MTNKNLLTKILALAGTLLVWFPLLAPVIFSLIRLARGGRFHFDYLTPAEFFPVALVGALLLLWAALRAGSQQKLIGWSLAVAVSTLIASLLLAWVTGLASGETGTDSIWWIFVLALIVIYILALLAIGIGGIWLLRHLFKKP